MQSRILPNLLIIDDDQNNVSLIEAIFSKRCTVDSAPDGRTGLKKLVERDYDVVLLDIMMPDLNGLDVLKIIRQSRDMIRLPVILISAVDDANQIARGIRLGANDYIPKPVEVDIIQARVNAQISLKRMADERQQLIVQLEERNAMKRRLMQVASHDLKNPLANLRILTSLMRRQIDDRERLERLIERADNAAAAMLSVIEGFLDSGADIDDSQIDIHLEPTEVQPIIEAVMDQFEEAARHKKITLQAETLEGTVMADPDRLAQVISNLVSNAVKYSPSETRITVGTHIDGHRWRLTVQDQGPGIPEQEQIDLFEPFRKASNQPTGGESSTGLGLWIVREMMRVQNGDVDVTCPPEGGSIFHIDLALAPADSSDSEDESSSSPPPQSEEAGAGL